MYQRVLIVILNSLFLLLSLQKLCAAVSTTSKHPVPVTRPVTVKNDKEVELINAVSSGNTQAVQALLESGVDVNLRDDTDTGKTMLMLAASKGHEDLALSLIKAGADIHAKEQNGITALMCAAMRGQKNILAELIKAGADVNAYEQKGFTALQFALNLINDDTKRTDVVKELILAGAHVNARYALGYLALVDASCHGYKDIVKLLIDAGANVNAHDDHGRTALIAAVEKGRIEVVEGGPGFVPYAPEWLLNEKVSKFGKSQNL